MEPVAASPDSSSDPPPVPAAPSRAAGRLRALAQVLACSGIPTQLLLVQLLAMAGITPFTDTDTLNLTWVFLLSLADTVLLGTLICVLLVANGESIRGVFLGWRPALPEVPVGLLSVLPVLVIAAAVLLTARAVAPWLHNVPVNPLGALMQSPRDIWLFAIVALVAGGIREELQRAFLLTRFVGPEKDSGTIWPFAYAFLVGLLQAQWTFTGYDASAHVTEETVDPSRNAPWGVFLSVAVSAVAGFAMLAAVTLAIGPAGTPGDLRGTAAAQNPFIHLLSHALGAGLGLLQDLEGVA